MDVSLDFKPGNSSSGYVLSAFDPRNGFGYRIKAALQQFPGRNEHSTFFPGYDPGTSRITVAAIDSCSGKRIPVHIRRIEHRTIRTHLPVSDILVHRVVAGLNHTTLANPVTACHAGLQRELCLDTP